MNPTWCLISTHGVSGKTMPSLPQLHSDVSRHFNSKVRERTSPVSRAAKAQVA